MASTLTGNEANFDPSVTFTATAPSDGDALSVASVFGTAATPDTGFTRMVDSGEFFREVFRGNLTGLKAMYDGAGNATPPSWTGDIPLIGTSGNAAGANPLHCFGLRDTTGGAAHVRFYRAASGALYITGNAYWDSAGALWTADAAGVISWALVMTTGGVFVDTMPAGSAPWAAFNYGTLTIGQGLVSNARSSGTVGAGQSVAAGTLYKDTTNFAWGKFRITAGPAITFDRGANVASVAYTGLGIYTVTLQTAVTNLMCIDVTAMDSQAGIVVVDSGAGGGGGAAPTTTVFRILYFDAAGGATDPTGTTGGFFFKVIAG